LLYLRISTFFSACLSFHEVLTAFSLFILFPTAIDLVDEAAAKLKMEITSKPTALDEINRSVLKLEMERLSLTNDTDKASKDRLSRLEAELSLLKEKQAELTQQWEHEKSVMTRIQSIKEEVSNLSKNMVLPQWKIEASRVQFTTTCYQITANMET